MEPNTSGRSYVPVEIYSVPDYTGEIKASDIYRTERLRVIADAHAFIVPLIFFLGAVFVWLSLRLLFAGNASRLRRLIGLWFEAKERELRTRAGRDPVP